MDGVEECNHIRVVGLEGASLRWREWEVLGTEFDSDFLLDGEGGWRGRRH